MTKTLFFFAFSLCAVASVGCSSSSSNSPGQDSGTDVSSGPVSDAANPLGSPTPGLCPGVPCDKGQTCCYNFLAGNGKCQAASMTCNGMSTMLGCSAPSDCSGDQICCFSITFGGGFSTKSSCMAAGACTAPSGAMGIAFQLCDSTHMCPTGDNCVSPPMNVGQAMFCQNPDAGFGFGFRPPMMDSGSGMMDDGGAPPEAAAPEASSPSDASAD